VQCAVSRNTHLSTLKLICKMRSALTLFLTCAVVCRVSSTSDLYVGPFQSGHWVEDTTESAKDPRAFHVQQHDQLPTKFIVALKHRDIDMLKKELLAVSMPKSGSYGKHLSAAEIRTKYAPLEEDLQRVVSFFEQIPGSYVELNKVGNMLQVNAPLQSVEQHLRTTLAWFRHSDEDTPKRSLRATSALLIPEDVRKSISFISLNSPISHNVKPKRVKSKVPSHMNKFLKDEIPTEFNEDYERNLNSVQSKEDFFSHSLSESSDSQPKRNVYVTEGNREVR
jgi:Pro-kumamolisin, activation domain